MHILLGMYYFALYYAYPSQLGSLFSLVIPLLMPIDLCHGEDL